mmetsp:Transcript_19606/g.34671  ORF Transcript_19606/g.34671 Transcript_19606/m.34671 type:complete len:182 (-) Transcript_19606:18-563(-)
MPYLPDGSFAVAEAWFAKRSRPKSAADHFWRDYDGFGQRHISFSWPDEVGQTALHEAAAFGRPTQAAAVLSEEPECWKVRTSKGRRALDVALDGVKWCDEHGRSGRERLRHLEVAELCRQAQDGKDMPYPEIDEEILKDEPGPPGYFYAKPSLPGLRVQNGPPGIPSSHPPSFLGLTDRQQ